MNNQTAMPDSPGIAGPVDVTPHERLTLTSMVAATLLLTTAMLTTIGILGEWPAVTRAATIVLGVFIVFEIFRVPVQQLVTGGVLITIGTLAALPSDGVFDVLKRASEGTLIFAAMFSAVAFLQYPALNSPSMYAAREVVVSQPSGRRYATLSVAAHLFGALTNFATLSLLSTFLSGNLEESARERMACAMTRGFALAASWSPFFISIAVILYVLPELKLLQIALPGIPLAALQLLYGWAYDKLTSQRHEVLPAPSMAPAPKKLEWSVIRKIGVLAITLVGLIIATTELLDVSTPIAIFLVTPIISLVWQWLLVRAKKNGTVPDMLRSVLGGISRLRAEIVMFLSANFLGYGAARVIDVETVTNLLLNLGVVNWVAIYTLLACMLIMAMLMIHPLVLIVLLGQVFPGEAIGVHPVSLALCMCLLWGIGTAASPGSGLTLFMTRVLGKSPWYVAWKLNSLYAVGGVFVGGAYIAVLNQWLL